MLIKITLLLALRSLILLVYEQKKWLNALFFAIYSILFIFLFNWTELISFSYKDIGLLAIALVIASTLFLRLTRPRRFQPVCMLAKSVGFCFFLLLAAFSLLMRFQEDQPMITMTLTGKTKEEWCEWKNPRTKLRQERLTSYEVVLETIEGKQIGTFYVFGDVVGVRAKVVRFHPFLHFFGIHDLFQVDALHNGYITPTNSDPYYIEPLTTDMWQFWQQLFFHPKVGRFIKSATLESTLFPLTDQEGTPLQTSYPIMLH